MNADLAERAALEMLLDHAPAMLSTDELASLLGSDVAAVGSGPILTHLFRLKVDPGQR